MQNYSNKQHGSFVLVIIIILLLVVTSCTRTSEPKLGSLNGRVFLVNDTNDPQFDPIDFSGVTIALYKLAELDSTIVRINQEYPQIGIQISQETEFDHRLQNPYRIVNSVPDGSFSFPKIEIGKYNLVAYKDNWSIRYIYEIEVLAGENKNKSIETSIELFPIRIMDAVIHQDIEFESFRTYMFQQDSIVLGNAVFQSNSLILIAPCNKVDFNANVNIYSDAPTVKISSSSNIYSTEPNEISRFLLVSTSSNSSVNIKGLILDQSLEGLIVRSNSAMLTNIEIKNCLNGLVVFGDSAIIKNLFMLGTSNRGIAVYGSMDLSTSIIYKNRDACFVSDAGAAIRNSYFIKNYMGIRPFYGEVSIHNNCFDKNDNAIAPCASDPHIFKNSFYDNSRDVELNGYYVQASMDYCNPTIENNNFFGSGWFYHGKGRNSVFANASYSGINRNQIFPNSYYKEIDVASHIYDVNHPDAELIHYSISALPRRNSVIIDAKIMP